MDTSRERIETSLGYAAERQDALWVLDLAELPILHGLSVLSRALAETLIQQARTGPFEVHLERKIRPRENPELAQRFGIASVLVTAGHACLARISDHPEACERHLRALLGNLQRRRYREALLPADGRASRALVADFSFDASPARGGGAKGLSSRFVLEYVPPDAVRRAGALRITIEDAGGRCLDLRSIPHVVLEDIESRTFIAGSTRIAQTWAESLRREAERGRRTFVEARKASIHLFQQLDRAGLAGFERAVLQWTDASMPLILEGEPHELEHCFKRVLLALEDRGLRRLLSDGECLRVDGGAASVYVDVSQLGRVLNVSLGARRSRSDVGAFLARMPALLRLAGNGTPLSRTSVFLVHHMTGEVVGLIAALRRLGCTDLTCLFVAYGGEEPPSYLEAILDLPAAEFRALALANVPTPGEVEGHYMLSTRYSQLPEADEIRAALAHGARHFSDAMYAVALPAFLRQLASAREAGRRILVVEDGGYLAPLLNRAVLEGRSVRELRAELGLSSADERPLAEALEGCLLGTVEHTRSGFDRLAEVEQRFGRLAFPAFSIAISRLKREVEAKEVATSVLNAVESVLAAGGRILSRRRVLVLGSRGAIGGALMRELEHRLEDPSRQLAGVDLKVLPGGAEARFPEARSFAELPPERRVELDLVLGVTGHSVVQGREIEEWLAGGEGRELVLASGSSKTVEFADVSRWLDGLLASPRPSLGGRALGLDAEDVTDPRTGRVYGRRFTFAVEGRAPNRLVLLANLTPVNFLFYGVPTELIDEVLAELVSCSLGLARRAASGELAPRLQAVDRDIGADGAPLAPRALASARASPGT
jgi:hypothetical protein